MARLPKKAFTLVELPAVSQRRRAAFTLVELLVVIGIIALLISILLPAMNKARTQAKNVQCMSQLRNLGQSVFMYAGENKGKMPIHGSAALWLWDVPLLTRDALVKKGGSRNTLYCPNFYEQNVGELWDGTFSGGPHDYAVIGYFWLGLRTKADDPNTPSALLPTLTARSYLTTLRTPKPDKSTPAALVPYFPRVPAETEVATDATLKQNGSWSATGGWAERHVSSHIKNGVPTSINILFLDGHVASRPYKANPTAADDVIRARAKLPTVPQIDFWF